MLTIYISGDNNQQYDEPLYRNYTKGKHVSITKAFPLASGNNIALKITLHPPYGQADWLPGSSVTLSNIKITIEYGT